MVSALATKARTVCLRSCALLGALAVAPRPTAAQQLGYKLLGSAGIEAGAQPPPGLALIVQALHFGSSEIRDRQGSLVPVDGLKISATGAALGASFTSNAWRRKWAPYVTFAVGAPVASIHVNSDNPSASLNGYGFADLFIEPLKVGWRERHFDVVTQYAVNAPTGHFEPRGVSAGSGYWTHQVSVGGALYADSARAYRASALASYDMNTRKRGIDIRRGNTMQVQGGAGATVKRIFVVGLAGYALWQVTPDRGTDIPPSLRNERSRTFGLGPEVDAVIPRWRTQVSLRVERDFGVESRPQGQVIALAVSRAMK
jgi:hypothetical protein